MGLLFAFFTPLVMAMRMHNVVESGGGSTEDKELLEKITTKVKEQTETALKDFNKQVEELKGLIPKDEKVITSKQLNEVAEKASQSLKELEEKIGKSITELKEDETIKSELQKMDEIVKGYGLEIKKLQEKQQNQPTAGPGEDNIQKLVKAYLESESFKKWADEGFIGSLEKMSLLKDGNLIKTDSLDEETRHKTVSVSVDHTGNIFITDPRLNVRDFPLRQTHIRDLMPVDTTDGTQITAPEVYDYTDALTGGMDMLAENDEAQDVGFKTRENTWTLKRIAAKLPLSKRYIKTNGLRWVQSYLGTRFPNFVRNKEDFQLLFGDGTGNNVDGLVKDAQQFDLTPVTLSVGAFASYEAYTLLTTDDATRIVFTNPHTLRNGDSLTIANATDGSYNATHTSVIVEDASTVIINVPYVAAETPNASWTGAEVSAWYQAVQSAQIYDVLVVAKSLLQTAEYMATGIVINPADLDKMGLLKATDDQYVGVSRNAFGMMTVNGLPIVTTTAMPAGQFLVGDFQMAVALSEYTSLSIKAYEDTQDASKNQVTWIIEEEFIMPKYNPFWFIYGRFDDAITQIDKP